VLTFVGLGLYDEEDVTVKGLQAIENADVVYAEFYSSKLIGTTIEKLEGFYKRESVCSTEMMLSKSLARQFCETPRGRMSLS